jgi:putative flippase GtrA
LLHVMPKGLPQFLAIGVCGLATDVSVLWLMERAGASPHVGRAISLTLATVLTWTLNRRYTFGPSKKRSLELGRYALVALVAQGFNYLIFLGLLRTLPWLSHSIAAVIGAVSATALSYTGQRFFTFVRPKAEPPPSL